MAGPIADHSRRAGSGRPIVVMKFGGTSVGSAEGRGYLVRRVAAALEQEMAPVVVVSAMGRAGDPYATDSLLALAQGVPEAPRDRDMLMATGEIISAVVCAAELRRSGLPAQAFSGADAGIGTDGVFGAATITQIHTGALRAAIARGTVPVVAGFQGLAEDGSVTTLGRGGSDTSACALGVALGAASVEIYSDVDGVMTADPRTCDAAVVLEKIRADELFQLARHGSRVVHTSAAELALGSGIAVRVRSTYTDHPGTLVADIASYKPASVATAVSLTKPVARIAVALGASEGTREHMSAQTRIFRSMADAGVSLDMFTPIGEQLVFTVSSETLSPAQAVLDRLGLDREVRAGLAKVTLVGAGMHGVPGVMARLAEHLERAGVGILQAADSHTTISVLVLETDAEAAVAALHEGFSLNG